MKIIVVNGSPRKTWNIATLMNYPTAIYGLTLSMQEKKSREGRTPRKYIRFQGGLL